MTEQELILSNTGLVVKIAKNFKPRNPTELDEYVQLGRIGLLKAIRRYNPSIGKLSTYAWYYIHGEIARYITKENKHVMCSLDSVAEEINIPAESIEDALPNSLTDTERQIIKMRLANHSFSAIGDSFGKTRFWANKVFHSAIVKIQDGQYEEKDIIR
jgi:RNA polymerase sigma factor (sigma-70 family)